MKATLGDIQDARRAMADLTRASSPIAWGAPIVSTVVTVGFFVFLIVLFRSRSADIDPAIAQIINIAVGALTAGFATVINFWLGSSQGSRNKDEVVRRFQESQAVQTEKAMETVGVVATRPTQPAVAPAVPAATVTAVAPPAVAAPPPAAATPPTVVVAPPVATPPAAAVVAPPPAAPPQRPIADNFDRCVQIILRHEGGFADHPRDPGGATNFGITLNTLRDWREDPNLTADDVRNLTKREAIEIYRARYWLPMRCNDLPPGVDLSVFDFGVNAGPSRSVKTLQRVLGVKDDGSVGPITLAAIGAVAPHQIVESFAEARLAFYQSLSTFDTFGRGWTRRTQEVASEARTMMA
jgi:hypothetical protein